MTFRTAYGPKDKSHPPQGGPSLTKQSFQQESNINFIISKYRSTGLLEHRAVHEGNYGEFAAIDFHEAMNAIRAAEAMFDSVPADIRKRFNNDPGQFVDFATNVENQEQLYELGLAERPIEAVVPGPTEPAPAPEPAP